MKTQSLLWLAALTMLACGSSEKNDKQSDPPEETGAAVNFCREFYAALCDHLELCACDAETVANCRRYECDGSLFQGADDPIARGTILFDQAAADAFFARLRDPSASCDGLYADADLDSYSANSLGGVFRGTLPEGSSCSLTSSKQKPGPTDCAEGLLCLPDSQGSERCVRMAKPGEACAVVPNEPDSSCLLQQGPDNDNEFESAFQELVCIPTAGSTTAGTCGTGAANGAACENGDQCASGRCVLAANDDSPRFCGQKLSSGSPCERSIDCETGYCSFGGATRLCVPQSADGVECTQADACRSGACQPDTTTGMDVCVTPPATTPAPLGSSCTTGSDCSSSYCYESRCAPRICSMFD